ncbi:hypothetical protein AVEN_131806-1 [Araneus ventricosus]|uniref:Uncharacterized protein n=1 Tax=Araneus ventricosus TaxID=182803 RepID=A0A4Y2SD55_ARAVE|nr:hypothetical protein AVEN_131806-1 [Araneus ventricosus]
MKRHKLGSPNLGGHLPHHPMLCYTLPLRRTEMGCGFWAPYPGYVLSDLKTSPPSKQANRLRQAFVAVKEELLDRPGRPRPVREG